ncbi:Rgp1-domain-containing protein, partial [Conidiobolus coronatus NRRL 28638]
MVVLVECSFLQNGVFYSGEKLSCQLKFTNVMQKTLGSATSDTSYLHSRSSVESNFGRVNTTSGFGQKKSSNGTKQKLNSLPNIPDQASQQQGSALHKPSQSLTHIQLDAVKNASQSDLRASSPLSGTSAVRASRPNSVSSWFAPFFSPTPDPTIVEPKEEKLLWGHIQLVGHFIVDSNLIPINLINEAKQTDPNTPTNSKRATYGGGSFVTNPTSINPFGGSLNSIKASSADINKSGLSSDQNNVFPVFSTPPSVLFVDLTLPLGESKTYQYEIKLPSNLPPTYRGKSFKILYYLILGTQREKITNDSNKIQIPFRLFSPISLGQGISENFDILQPRLVVKDESIIKNLDSNSNVSGGGNNKLVKRRSIGGKKHLQMSSDEFIEFALNSLENKKLNGGEDSDEEMESFGLNNASEDHLSHSSSILNVLQISNRSRSASINIHKGDTVVAKVCLRKSHYRIGETLYGVVEFLKSPIKCLQIVISLESYEQITKSFTNLTIPQIDSYTKIIHSECMKVCTNLERTGFSLTIPSTCSQGFETSVASYQY